MLLFFPACTTLFPTPVGVVLRKNTLTACVDCLPHARGGVSSNRLVSYLDSHSSPRPWGCFQDFDFFPAPRNLFPTLVGVVPTATGTSCLYERLPHARGGGFQLSPPPQVHHQVFPTHVGVLLKDEAAFMAEYRLPHARGGVSSLKDGIGKVEESSPRPWGGFLLICDQTAEDYVFPTLVGVFPHSKIIFFHFFCLPHARGGGSI